MAFTCCCDSRLEEEKLFRMKFADFLQNAGTRLKFPQMATLTAISLFHRFFQFSSFEKFDPHSIARACLYVTSKAEETPRTRRDIVTICHRLQFPKDQILQPNSSFMEECKEDIVYSEQVVLRALNYELGGKHPHHYVLHFLQNLTGSSDVAKVAWNILNDSTRTMVWARYRPHSVACAAIYLAIEFLGLQQFQHSSDNKEWWLKFDVSWTQMESILLHLLDFYDRDDVIILPSAPSHVNTLS